MSHGDLGARGLWVSVGENDDLITRPWTSSPAVDLPLVVVKPAGPWSARPLQSLSLILTSVLGWTSALFLFP